MKKLIWKRYANEQIDVCYECVLSELPEQVMHIQKEGDFWHFLFNGSLVETGSFVNMKKLANDFVGRG